MAYKITVILPEKLSMNKYHTMHYMKLYQMKNHFYEAVKYADREGYLDRPPYEVHYHFRIWGAQMDLSNLMGMVKPLEDGLVKCGVFEDDNPGIIAKMTITEEKAPESSIKNKRSYCQITIKPHNIATE
jgi:hypothetical protein